MPDFLLLLLVVLPLLAYIIRDVGARWEREHAKVITISIMVAFYSTSAYLVISEVSSYTISPYFEEPDLSILWLVTNMILIVLAARYYHGARYNFKLEEEKKVEVVDYVDQQLAGRLKPLEGALVGVQKGMSELTGKVSALNPKVEKLTNSVDGLATTTLTHMKALTDFAGRFELREAAYKEIAVQYDRWYNKRIEADRELKDLITKAEDMLVRCDIIVDQMDEFIDTGMTGLEPPSSWVASPTEGVNHGQGTIRIPGPPANGETLSPSAGGKLTKEKGIANRERGNNAQLKFCEEVLRGAGKLVDNSIKEGTPDYVFYAPGTHNAKAVGGLKALTLREDGTRQRWIPRRKVLAELRLALKLGVPLILFVQNFANGRIWAKVLPVEEFKEFTGLTTPLMLVENDAQAEKACKETLEMALQLL